MSCSALMTASGQFRKVRRTNATDSSFAARIPTVTDPLKQLRDGVAASGTLQEGIVLAGTGFTPPMPGSMVQNSAIFVPYATASNDGTFSFRVYGWDLGGPPTNNSATTLWVPILLAEFACIASSTFPGIAGTPLGTAEFFCDTITTTFAATNLVQVSSPGGTTANSGIAFVQIDFIGFGVIEPTFKTTASTTDMNALMRLL